MISSPAIERKNRPPAYSSPRYSSIASKKATPYFSAFFSPTPAVIHAGAVYLQGIMPFYFMFAIMFCLNNAMRGAGDSVFPMVDVILSLILVRVPAVYYLADRFGPDYMYLGCAVGWAVGLALSVLHYLSGRWKSKSVAGGGEAA